MRQLQELATQVLLGTERRQPVLSPMPGALGDLLDAACPEGMDSEIRVLRTAGAMAICAQAGFVPAGTNEDLPEACPPEDRHQAASQALTPLLRQILDEGPDPLRHEALQLLATNATCLPPGLLYGALSLAQKTPELRPALLPALGQRGLWLAKFNPVWSFAVGRGEQVPDVTLWVQGTQEQRKHLLGRLRETDPGRARGLLQDGFAELDARERANLLEQLGIGLHSADEDFLEAALADRSKEVRLLAGSLLARLPTSRYAARMAERLAACLGQERKFLRQVQTLEAPEQFGADWKADALEQSRAKSESLGERAWWLYQIARALPLAWWPVKTGMSPAELIKWLSGTDWSEAILRAWSDALRRQPDPAWAAAFLASPALKGLTVDVFDLLACLPATEREQHWLAMLKDTPSYITQGDLVSRIVRDFSPGRPGMSVAFARHVLEEISKILSRPSYVLRGTFDLCQALPEFVCLIPPACLDEATKGWPAGQPETEYFNTTMARILAIVEQRKTLHRSLSQRKSS